MNPSGGIRCLIFGYGYMGKIRHQALKRHPAVGNVTIVDPQLDPQKVDLEGALLAPDTRIPWEQTDAVFICTPNNVRKFVHRGIKALRAGFL